MKNKKIIFLSKFTESKQLNKQIGEYYMTTGLQTYYESLEDLYKENYRLVLYLLNQYINDKSDIDDLNSAFWLSMTINSDKLLSLTKAEVKSYVSASVKNAAIDHSRRHKSDPDILELNDEICSECANTINLFSKMEDISLINELISYLSDEEISILEYRYKSSLSFSEIAKRLSLNENTVRSKHHRALLKLRVAANAIHEDFL